MYIMMEINFDTHIATIFGVTKQTSPHFKFSIKVLERPLKIQVGFKSEMNNSVGLGLVRV